MPPGRSLQPTLLSCPSQLLRLSLSLSFFHELPSIESSDRRRRVGMVEMRRRSSSSKRSPSSSLSGAVKCCKVLSIVGLLQEEVDPMVSVMKVEKAPLESYANIGDLDAKIQEIKEAVELPLIHPELYEDIGIKPPKGVILYGEPGTRKNLLAKFSSSPPSPPLPSGARGMTPTACSSRSSPSPNWGCSINYYPIIQPQRNRKVRAIFEDEEDRTNVVLFDRHAQTILRQPVDSTKEMF